MKLCATLQVDENEFLLLPKLLNYVRWALELQQYKLTIKRTYMHVPDGLFGIPLQGWIFFVAFFFFCCHKELIFFPIKDYYSSFCYGIIKGVI